MARITMTPMVRIALWALRIYLLILLSLIALKFSRILLKPKSGPPVPAAVQSPALAPTKAPLEKSNSTK